MPKRRAFTAKDATASRRPQAVRKNLVKFSLTAVRIAAADDVK
jgi:hypothetical protein